MLISPPWAPGGLMDPYKPDAPPEAHLAQSLAKRLRTVRGNQALRQVAHQARTSTRPIFDTLHGNRWGSLPTVARLRKTSSTATSGATNTANKPRSSLRNCVGHYGNRGGSGLY